MKTETYIEDFNDGPGGWFRVVDNFQPPQPLQIQNSIAWSRGPWWVDYNHAPPGGGYLQLLMCLNTKGSIAETIREVAGTNRFIAANYPTNFANAKISVRLSGELETPDAKLCLLVQGRHDGRISGWVLTGQPIPVTKEVSETTVTAVQDERQWTSLGSRHDRSETYATRPLATVLGDVNVNIYLVMFPVLPRAMGPIDGDANLLRAGRDYPIWPSSVTQGFVGVDRISIEFHND